MCLRPSMAAPSCKDGLSIACRAGSAPRPTTEQTPHYTAADADDGAGGRCRRRTHAPAGCGCRHRRAGQPWVHFRASVQLLPRGQAVNVRCTSGSQSKCRLSNLPGRTALLAALWQPKQEGSPGVTFTVSWAALKQRHSAGSGPGAPVQALTSWRQGRSLSMWRRLTGTPKFHSPAATTWRPVVRPDIPGRTPPFAARSLPVVGDWVFTGRDHWCSCPLSRPSFAVSACALAFDPPLNGAPARRRRAVAGFSPSGFRSRADAPATRYHRARPQRRRIPAIPARRLRSSHGLPCGRHCVRPITVRATLPSRVAATRRLERRWPPQTHGVCYGRISLPLEYHCATQGQRLHAPRSGRRITVQPGSVRSPGGVVNAETSGQAGIAAAAALVPHCAGQCRRRPAGRGRRQNVARCARVLLCAALATKSR